MWNVGENGNADGILVIMQEGNLRRQECVIKLISRVLFLVISPQTS